MELVLCAGLHKMSVNSARVTPRLPRVHTPCGLMVIDLYASVPLGICGWETSDPIWLLPGNFLKKMMLALGIFLALPAPLALRLHM